MTGQVEIISKYGNIYLYTHNDAESLVKKVYNVLSKRVNWNDAGYLARMIFCEMIPKDKWSDDKGFGISPSLYLELDLYVTLDIENQTIKTQILSNKHDWLKFTFEDFIKKFFSNAEL